MDIQKVLFTVFPLTLIFAVTVGAQSNDVIDRFLEQNEAYIDTTIYLAMIAGDRSPDSVSVESAVRDFDGEFTRPTMKGGVLTVGDFAAVVVQTLDIPRGIMSRIFSGPRYATRDLKALGIIPNSASQFDTLSGEGALSLLGYAVSWKETYQ